MKFSFGEIVGLLILCLVLYGGIEYRHEVLIYLRNQFPREVHVDESAKRAVAVSPLPGQIAQCRKQKSGFQSCMFQAGYAINSAWTSAHNAAQGAANPALAAEIVRDPYRAEPSPAYGVPYWVPRQQ